MNTEKPSLWGVLAGSALGAGIALGGVALTSRGQEPYGTALFVGLPVLQGLVAALVAQIGGPYPWRRTASTACYGALLSTVGALAFRWEGLVCILMAAPLAVPIILLGAWVGWLVTRGPQAPMARLHLPAIAMLALAVGGTTVVPAPPSRGEVRTVWHVAAPPERVWPSVLSLPSMSAPDWWLFRLGVAHPVSTRTFEDGRRECLLSTGPMPEIVTIREEGRRLAFRVLSTPPSMREANPFGEVDAPHLRTTFRSLDGEFTLVPEGSGTRIEARSAYELRMAPFGYWRVWCDAVVGHVHERVAREIARRASRKPQPLSSLKTEGTARGKVTS